MYIFITVNLEKCISKLAFKKKMLNKPNIVYYRIFNNIYNNENITTNQTENRIEKKTARKLKS